jgi:hypothetical protein
MLFQRDSRSLKRYGDMEYEHLCLCRTPQNSSATSNFDELYLRATTFNDTFQMRIGSLFLATADRRSFVYEMMPRGNFQAAEAAEATEEKRNKGTPLKGRAIRGPVKRPHRAIAKVCIHFNSKQSLQNRLFVNPGKQESVDILRGP